jgi:hypothetical protein
LPVVFQEQNNDGGVRAGPAIVLIGGRGAGKGAMLIETEWLVLREFVADDWPRVLAYQSVPRYLRYYEWTGCTENEVRAFVGMFIGWRATEGTRASVAFGFDTLRLHRIAAICVADHVASTHVLEKLGLQREGRLREVAYYKGRWWDELVYGLLEGEWQARR